MINLDELAAAVQCSVSAASEIISERNNEHLLSYFEPPDGGSDEPLRPKTVRMDFPAATANGSEVHTVHVPLIAVCPHVGVRISTLKFTAELEAALDETGAVKVAFPELKLGGVGALSSEEEAESGPSLRAPITIEIVVESTPAPDGLKKLVEGYSRALRAQIPG